MDNEILKAIQELRTEMNQRFDLVGNRFDRNRKADRIESMDLFVKLNAKMDSGFMEMREHA